MSRTTRLPSFSAVQDPVLLERKEPGIVIVAAPWIRHDNLRSIKITGMCQCRPGALKDLQVSIIEAVAILAVYGDRHDPVTCAVVGDALVFEDDIIAAGPFRRGFFEIDLFEQVGILPVPGRYFISASFDQYLSNVVTVHL